MWGSTAGLRLPFFCDPPRVPRACLLGSSLTPPRTARGPTVAFRLLQSRQRAAMRWRGGLGSSLLRDYSLTLCHCSFVPATLASTPHSSSFFEIAHFVPAASAVTPCPHSLWLRWGSGVGVVVVAEFPGGALSLFLLLSCNPPRVPYDFLSSSSLTPPRTASGPNRGLSDLAESPAGRDAVARRVRPCHRGFIM